MAVVGYGPVGRRIEHTLAGLGLDVTCVRRAARGDETCTVRTLDELPAVCAESDVVVLALPFTDDTAGILSHPSSRRWPPTRSWSTSAAAAWSTNRR